MAAAWAIKKHKASNPTILKSREKKYKTFQVFVISVTSSSLD